MLRNGSPDQATTDLIVDCFDREPLTVKLLVRYRDRICPFAPIEAAIPADARLLDIGCGLGLLLMRLAATGRIGDGVGVEVSNRAINRANEAYRRLKSSRPSVRPLRFMQVDSPRGWPQGQFDVVTMVDVLHHIAPAEQEAFFRAAAQRVKPGGTLIYKDMARRPTWRAMANRVHDLALARQWIHYCPLADVEQWAAEDGLLLDRRAKYSRLAYAHELARFCRPH